MKFKPTHDARPTHLDAPGAMGYTLANVVACEFLDPTARVTASAPFQRRTSGEFLACAE